MILVEFRLDQPILREALTRYPETTVSLERSDTVDGKRVRPLVWVAGDRLDAFEDAMASDPTVSTPVCRARLDSRRLYQTELVGDGLEASMYPTLVETGAVLRGLTGTHEGWEWRVAFPDRQAITQFFDRCAERGVEATVHRLYEVDGSGPGSTYGLTEAQRETLVLAAGMGYFDVPRTADLGDLGSRLGISDTATSQRLRRGMKSLVQRTLGREQDDVADGDV